MSIGSRLIALFALTVPLVGLAHPAGAQSRFDASNAFVVLTGHLEVKSNETVSAAVIFDGDATIDGKVTGDVVAFNGDVLVTGSVSKNVVALNGRVTVTTGAIVGGDVVSRLTPVVDGTVNGSVKRTRFNANDLNGLAFFGRFVTWIATTVSSFLLGLFAILFAPRAVDVVVGTATRRFGASIGFGALAFFAIPLVAFIAIATLVGIPIGLGVLLALGLVYWIGYVAAAISFGRQLVKPPRHLMLAFLAGWGILRVVALIPFIGGLTWFVASIWGLGAVVLAARSAGRLTRASPPGSPAVGLPMPIPPPPGMPTP